MSSSAARRAASRAHEIRVRDQDPVKMLGDGGLAGRSRVAPTASPGSRCCAVTPPRPDTGALATSHSDVGVTPSSTAASTTRATGRAAGRARHRAQQGRRVPRRLRLDRPPRPELEVVAAVGERFELHPLAVEDAVHAHQRPKLEVLRRHALPRAHDGPARAAARSRRDRRGHGVRRPALRGRRPPRRGQPAARRAARPRGPPGPPRHRAELGPLRRRRPHRRRLRQVLERLAVEVDAVEADVFAGLGANPTERIYRLKREALEFKARWRRSSRRCSASPPTRPGCRSTRAPRPTSATSTTT